MISFSCAHVYRKITILQYYDKKDYEVFFGEKKLVFNLIYDWLDEKEPAMPKKMTKKKKRIRK
jgi:hypothetical protein